MKYVNLIKLLSVLVCLVVVLAACDGSSEADTTTGAQTTQQTESELTTTTEESQTETESETETRGPVDPVLENYFEFPEFTPPVVLENATEIDGEIISSTVNNELIVIRQAKLGFDNEVKETFTVYNTMLGKTVLTVENTYSYGSYDEFDWNDIYNVNGKNYPECDVQVSIEGEYDYITGAYESVYIVVKKAEFSKIDETVREENPNGSDYEVDISYVYYDAAGKEFARSSSLTPNREYMYDNEHSYALSVGDTLAIFDLATHELISVTDSMKNKVVGGFDVKVGNRGYVLDSYLPGALGAWNDFLEVYDLESGECTLRYRYEKQYYQAFVLNNGNVLITYMEIIEEDDGNVTPDIVIMGIDLTVENYLLDVSTGKLEATDFNYFPTTIINRENYLASDNSGIEITENVDNVFIGLELGQRATEMTDMRIMALNNDLTVSFVMEPLVPEQNLAEMLNGDGIVTLENGDYLVVLDSAATARAIVTKDGRVRSYLSDDAHVAGNFVVTPDGVYDYDMNELFTFEADGYSFVTDVRGRIIVSKMATRIDVLHNVTEEVLEYYVLDRTESGFYASLIFDGQTIVPEQTTDDYIVTRHNETGKYTLYNIELEHVLTTSSAMYICEIDGKYTVRTVRNDGSGTVSVLYTLE